MSVAVSVATMDRVGLKIAGAAIRAGSMESAAAVETPAAEAAAVATPAAGKGATASTARAVIMTSFAFILGVYPLVVAKGAAEISRHDVGTPVFAGMIPATFMRPSIKRTVTVLLMAGTLAAGSAYS
jgi:AcrB/AcrD/AcrF family